MTSFDELKTTIRRNQLLGMWAAEKLGLSGAAADDYAKVLATEEGAIDHRDGCSLAARVVGGRLAGNAGPDDDDVESVHGADHRRRGWHAACVVPR